MSMESTKALFDTDPQMQAHTLRVAAALPACTDEDILLGLLIDADRDIYRETADHLGYEALPRIIEVRS